LTGERSDNLFAHSQTVGRSAATTAPSSVGSRRGRRCAVPKRSFDPADVGDAAGEPPPVSHQLPPLPGPRMPLRPDPARPGPAQTGELTDRTVVKERPQPPVSGWRRVLHRAGGGRVEVGDSAAGRT